MSCLGVHFALPEEDVAALKGIVDMRARLDFLQRSIEERYMKEPATYAAESVNAWDAMHRVLSDGYLSWDGGNYPLNHTVIGGECLYFENDYIMSLKTPEQVRDIASALNVISEAWFREQYFALPANDYSAELSVDDFDYTWERFEIVRQLYRRAATEERYVLFTADQ